MANSIATFKKYIVGLLDEVYAAASKTSVLDGAPELAREGSNANELIIPKISMDGLGEYSANSGYTSGDVTFTNETVKCNFDRGRMFSIDNVENMDTAGMAFGQLSAQFIRTKVVPELDAFRFATYAGVAGAKSSVSAAYTDGETLRKAIAAVYDAMTNNEVPEEGRYLFITPAYEGMLRDMDTTKSRELLAKFTGVVSVPQSRFYTAITQYDGKTAGQTAGGYIKDAANGKDINFMIIQKDAVIQFTKHVAPKIVTPEQNQDADAYKFGYRNVSIADAYDNKVAGVAVEYLA